MDHQTESEILAVRDAPLDLEPEEFRALGHQLVDRIAGYLAELKQRPVTPAGSPAQVREALHAGRPLPDSGSDAGLTLHETADLLFKHSLSNGHPRFFGYITSSAAPIGMLADLLASTVNPNCGAWKLAPMATEIEAQAVRWIAELIGYHSDSGGLMVSGGNMANFVGFLAARAAKIPWDVRKAGLGGARKKPRVYTSAETHTWIQKAADLFGLGTDAIRWIPVDKQQRIMIPELRRRIQTDEEQGEHPFLVVGTAGTVSTGAVDPLPEIAAICRERELWFHVDGAYGAVATAVPGAPADLAALREADSVAVDPHKWLYAPLEAGCALVRGNDDLLRAFSYHPTYYHFDEDALNYFDFGMQNSRGFRALKVWLALRQTGRQGYLRMIGDDIALAKQFHRLVTAHPELEALTQNLSITTFRYVPPDLAERTLEGDVQEYLDRLNQALLSRIEKSGEAFFSNAVVDGKFALRMCIVNFRTSLKDIEELPDLIARFGRAVAKELPPASL